MGALGWTLLGFGISTAIMLPLAWLMRRRAEQASREAERRALESERLAELGAMTSGLAHEIKNPLSTVGLNAQLLREDISDLDVPEADRRRLDRRAESLSREVDRLGDILGDFLQFAGRFQLDAQPVDLVRILDDLVDFFDPQCKQHGILLRTQHAPGPVVTIVDEKLLKQALLNLLLNAVQAMCGKHETCQSGTCELMVRIEDDSRQHPDEVHIHVIDTGPGIDPDKIDEIFHPYVSGRRGGTGLGLPTSRRIIEEHGGRLEARSEPGHGCDFIISLPRQKPQPE